MTVLARPRASSAASSSPRPALCSLAPPKGRHSWILGLESSMINSSGPPANPHIYRARGGCRQPGRHTRACALVPRALPIGKRYAWGWAVWLRPGLGRQSAAADWCRDHARSGVHREPQRFSEAEARRRLRQRGCDFAVPRSSTLDSTGRIARPLTAEAHSVGTAHSPTPCSKRCGDSVAARAPAALNRPRAICVIDGCRGCQSVIGREDPRPILRSGRSSPRPRLCTGPAPSR